MLSNQTLMYRNDELTQEPDRLQTHLASSLSVLR